MLPISGYGRNYTQESQAIVLGRSDDLAKGRALDQRRKSSRYVVSMTSVCSLRQLAKVCTVAEAQ